MKKLVLIIIALMCTPAFAISTDVCFTPAEHCAPKIIAAIDQAKNQILVQAYSFTSIPIADALIAAKEHGVDVEVLLDKSQLKGKSSVLPNLLDNHIPAKIDYLPAIAHNKIMVIDGNTIVTGSYNFTANAENKNAENLLIIHDPALAFKYANNWWARERVSR